MINIKISKEGKYYLSQNNIRVSIDYDEIEKLNESYFACRKRELDYSQTYFFLNAVNANIEMAIENCLFRGKCLGKNKYFILDQKRNYKVFESDTLKEVITISKSKDYHDFVYIKESYYFLDEYIYNGNEILGKLNDFDIIYKDENFYTIRKINDFYLFSIEQNGYPHDHREYTLIKNEISTEINTIVINSSVSSGLFLFIKSNNKYNIYYDGNLIHHCKIDEEKFPFTTNFFGEVFIHFYIDQKLYFLTKNKEIHGPFSINDFEYKQIHENHYYKIFYCDKHLIKYDKFFYKITIEKINFNFTKTRSKVLYIKDNSYELLMLEDQLFFYNNFTNKFDLLDDRTEIIPEIFVDEIYYLGYDLLPKIAKPKINILDLGISDYMYFNNNLYLILADIELIDGNKSDNSNYIVYDVNNDIVLKTFNSFIEFNSNFQFLLADTKYHASSFIYTLDQSAKKIIKLPFKTKGINDNEELIKSKVIDVLEYGICFINMDSTEVLLTNTDPIYVKE
jgi:hypothetical protein